MTLDLAPRPGAAGVGRMIAAQVAMETRLLLRNGEQLLLALVIPLLLLVAGTESSRIVDLGPGRPIDIIAPGVLALAILSSSFTSLAIATGFERRYGVIKRLGSTPLPRWGLLVGKAGSVLLVQLVQLVVLCAVALWLGWQPHGGAAAYGWLVVYTLLGTAAFGALALLVAGTLRAEATLAVANLVYVLLLVGGAVLVPLDRYPEAAQAPMTLLPTAALSDGLRTVFAGDAPPTSSLVVLLVWAGVASVATARTFKWE
ncbi:ABC-2 type transport system permease protein [Mumia flava]|uniref:Transport permease protein n=1 Tax=Mumia flava TaxID=1348852 RepID=A0A0B2B406_9ACTN|nr:ABC transporter permease [Mumia flava]PJJ53600.1 ABC-2 type transport system permease protein [Mumia flava]